MTKTYKLTTSKDKNLLAIVYLVENLILAGSHHVICKNMFSIFLYSSTNFPWVFNNNCEGIPALILHCIAISIVYILRDQDGRCKQNK